MPNGIHNNDSKSNGALITTSHAADGGQVSLDPAGVLGVNPLMDDSPPEMARKRQLVAWIYTHRIPITGLVVFGLGKLLGSMGQNLFASSSGLDHYPHPPWLDTTLYYAALITNGITTLLTRLPSIWDQFSENRLRERMPPGRTTCCIRFMRGLGVTSGLFSAITAYLAGSVLYNKFSQNQDPLCDASGPNWGALFLSLYLAACTLASYLFFNVDKVTKNMRRTSKDLRNLEMRAGKIKTATVVLVGLLGVLLNFALAYFSTHKAISALPCASLGNAATLEVSSTVIGVVSALSIMPTTFGANVHEFYFLITKQNTLYPKKISKNCTSTVIIMLLINGVIDSLIAGLGYLAGAIKILHDLGVDPATTQGIAIPAALCSVVLYFALNVPDALHNTARWLEPRREDLREANGLAHEDSAGLLTDASSGSEEKNSPPLDSAVEMAEVSEGEADPAYAPRKAREKKQTWGAYLGSFFSCCSRRKRAAHRPHDESEHFINARAAGNGRGLTHA